MAHIDGAAGEGAQRVGELELELPAQVAVERGERLVEQQELGLARHDARERHALLLTARELRRALLLKAIEAKGRDLAGDGLRALLFALAEHADGDVLLDRHVGEQRVVLEEVAHAPLLRAQVDARRGVEQHAAVEDDPALVGDHDAGDALERHRLAAARGAEKRERLVGGLDLERHVERKRRTERLAHVDLQAHRAPPRSTRPGLAAGFDAALEPDLPFCSNQFMARRTTAEMPRLTMTHAKAPASSFVRHSW